MPFDTELTGRTAETLTAGFTGTIGTTVTLAGNAGLDYADNTILDAYGLSAGESESGVHVVFTEEVAGTNLWQSAVVTLDYDTNSLTIDTIGASSNGGLPVTFTAAAAANVPLYHPPIETPAPVTEADPTYTPIVTTKKLVYAYLNRIETVPDWVTCIDCMFANIQTRDDTSPRLVLGYGSGTYQRIGYQSGGRYLTVLNTSLAANSSTEGILISQNHGHDSIAYYSGNIRLTRGGDNHWNYTVHSHYGFDTQFILSGSIYLGGELTLMKFETGSAYTFNNGTVTFRMA